MSRRDKSRRLLQIRARRLVQVCRRVLRALGARKPVPLADLDRADRRLRAALARFEGDPTVSRALLTAVFVRDQVEAAQ